MNCTQQLYQLNNKHTCACTLSSPCGQCSRWMRCARASQPILNSAWMTSLHPNPGLLLIFMFSISVNQTATGLWGFLNLIPSMSLGIKPNSVPISDHFADSGESAFTSSFMDMAVAEKQSENPYSLFMVHVVEYVVLLKHVILLDTLGITNLPGNNSSNIKQIIFS